MNATIETETAKPGSLHRLVRVRAEWRDWCACNVLLLEEYIPPRRWLWWTTKGRWEKRTNETVSIMHAEEWCKHYGVKIEWPNDPNKDSVRCYDCGRPYKTFDLDVIVPDKQWEQICPKQHDGSGSGGILCPNCTVKRGSKLPGVTVARLVFEK